MSERVSKWVGALMGEYVKCKNNTAGTTVHERVLEKEVRDKMGTDSREG